MEPSSHHLHTVCIASDAYSLLPVADLYRMAQNFDGGKV